MSDVVRELVALVGFQVDEHSFNHAVHAFHDLEEIAEKAIHVVEKVGEAIVEFALHAAHAGTEAFLASQKIGISVESLKELGYAASLAHVSSSSLEGALLNLNRATSGIGARAKIAQKLIADLGVKTKDAGGKVRPTEEVFADVAGALGKMPNAAKRSAIAMRIFGSSGADLIPLFLEGKDGIEEMRQEAQDLGLVMSTETAEAAHHLTSALVKQEKIFESIKIQIGRALIPTLTEAVDAFVEWYKINRKMISLKIEAVMARVVDGWHSAVAAGRALFAAVMNVVNAFGGLQGILRVTGYAFVLAFGASFLYGVGQAVAGLGKMVASLRLVTLAELQAFIGPALLGAAFLALGVVIALVIDDFAEFAQSSDHSTSALGQFLDTFNKPFNGKDGPVMTFLKLVAKTLDTIVTAAEKAGKGLGALGIIFDNESTPQQKLEAGKDLRRGFGGVDWAGKLSQDEAASIPMTGAWLRSKLFRPAHQTAPVLPPLQMGSAEPGGGATITDNRQVHVTIPGSGDPGAVADEVVRRVSQDIQFSDPVTVEH